MTEILFRVVDVPHPDPNIHVRRYHRGDIVAWRVDGFTWGERELTYPVWRIIRIGLTMTEVNFLAREEEDTFKNKGRIWARVRKINFDDIAIKGGFKNFLVDDTRATPILNIGKTTTLNTLIVEKGDADDFTGI